jgi:hypothetical protein
MTDDDDLTDDQRADIAREEQEAEAAEERERADHDRRETLRSLPYVDVIVSDDPDLNIDLPCRECGRLFRVQPGEHEALEPMSPTEFAERVLGDGQAVMCGECADTLDVYELQDIDLLLVIRS